MKKNIIIIMIAIISLGLTIYITFRKINTNEQNKNEQLTEEELDENDKIVEENNEFTNKNSELKEIKRCLVYVEETDNVKRYYFGGLKYDTESYRTEDVIKLAEIDYFDGINNIHIYVDNSNAYLSYINEKEYIVKKIDLTKGNGNYTVDDYKKISMPLEYEICGLWEGHRKDNSCPVKSFFYNDYIYFFTKSSEYKESIYVYNTISENINLIYTSEGQATLRGEPEMFTLDEYFIFSGIDGIFYSNLDGKNLKNIKKNDASGNTAGKIKIINGELYYSFGKFYKLDEVVNYKYDFIKNESIKVD